MNEAAFAELRALRERLAELEQLAAADAGASRGPMYAQPPADHDYAKQNELAQDEMTARAWRWDHRMESILDRLDKNRDDPAVDPGMRISAALYGTGKAAAKRHNLDTSGGNR